jgi:hypothetical protein
MKTKKLWIVYWEDNRNGNSEFVELWSTEQLAQAAAEKYEESHAGVLTFTYEEIELMK